jgi:hypothetical protein
MSVFSALFCAIEFDPIVVAMIVLAVVIGVPVLTVSFFVVRRLHELHESHNKIDGELYISDDGDMYAEYGIPIPEILERNYILLKVNHIGGKENE